MRQASIELRAGTERFRTVTEQTETWHSFSFGAHYDPGNVAFGSLIAHNEDHLVAGGGYAEHRHAGLEILTWVLSGALAHTDSAGHDGVVTRGLVQRLSSGSGVEHAERATTDAPVHLVQMWLTPDTPTAEPSYQLAPVRIDDLIRGWVSVASETRTDAAVRIDVRGATLWATLLRAGGTRALPVADRLHIFVATGVVTVSGAPGGAWSLVAGDALRLVEPPALILTAEQDAEILVWELPR